MIGNFLFIIISAVSIIAGVAITLYSAGLYRKYRYNYLLSYLYNQILIIIFGIFSILGTVFVSLILDNFNIPLDKIESIIRFLPFLGLPFLITAWYMFVKTCREITEKNISTTFTITYFISYILLFFSYGIIIYEFPDITKDQSDMISPGMIRIFAIFEIISIGIGVSQVFIFSRNITDKKKAGAIQNFGYIILCILIMNVVLLLLLNQGILFILLLLLIYFAGDLPCMIYLNSFLKKYGRVTVIAQNEIRDMNDMIDKYNISKREAEVIEQICEGKTNKEISDALFISLQTVKDHTHRIYLKTDIRNRVQLINLVRGFEKTSDSGFRE